MRYGVAGQGPPVVVVHGTPWSSFNMRHLIAGLSRDFSVYHYDLLGYGQSDRSPGDVSLGVQNRVLAELMDHWGIGSPAVVGHDFGGATVLRSHLLDGCGFQRIVLVDPVALSPWGSPFFRHVRAHEEAFAGVPGYIHDAVVRAYVKTAAHRPLPRETLDGIVRPWTGPAGQAAFYRQIAQADSRFTDEVEPLYPSIDRPVLILWGREDTWIPVERGAALHAKIPGSSFQVVPDAGHLVIEEEPGILVEKIRSFFREGAAEA